jgi:hypothetical protein
VTLAFLRIIFLRHFIYRACCFVAIETTKGALWNYWGFMHAIS